jgi:hypothetical protein
LIRIFNKCYIRGSTDRLVDINDPVDPVDPVDSVVPIGPVELIELIELEDGVEKYDPA